MAKNKYMKEIFKKYSKVGYRVILFLLAAGTVLYVLPRQGKFRYEYSQGKLWRHETLMAPFDFPVYKSQSELKIEKDLILQNLKPYFIDDETIGQKAVENFITDFNLNIDKMSEQFPFIENFIRSKNKMQISIIENKCVELLQNIYQQGLIEIPDEIPDINSFEVIMVVKNNFAMPYEAENLFNYQTAYKSITSALIDYITNILKIKQDDAEGFISQLHLNKYLKVNLLYNEERTESEKQNILKNISLTSGLIIAGQRIIDTGEIINEDTGKILDSLKMEYESRLGKGRGAVYILLGQTALIVVLFVLTFFFIYVFRKKVYDSFASVCFLMLVTVLMVILAWFVQTFEKMSLYIIPFAILPLIVRIFLDSRLAFFFHVVIMLMCALFSSNSFEFIVLQIPIGIVAIVSLYRMVRRSQLLKSAFLIILTYSLIYTGLALWQEGDITRINLKMYGHFAINGSFMLLVYPLIYIFERTFGFLSDVTLVELSDTNHPLLRKLAENSPGTFQHSIQVANLAQEAVYKIGANPLLVRAGAMYHDIGKMDTPMFFTENQAGGINPHKEISFEESSKAIIYHVESGAKMANKSNIPTQIIDFIKTHHGTTKTKFFYNSYINKFNCEPKDISAFTYPGPSPFTKETAVLMMADSVEAASRSIKVYTNEEIDNLVERIINDQIADNQFINSPITFKDIAIIKDTFKSKLKNIYHTRIEYPTIKK